MQSSFRYVSITEGSMCLSEQGALRYFFESSSRMTALVIWPGCVFDWGSGVRLRLSASK